MVRQTRHLVVGNLPDNIHHDRIRDHFKRYGRVQNVTLLSKGNSGGSGSGTGEGGGTGGEITPSTGMCAAVAFMDIKSAAKAHSAEHTIDERILTTDYYEPAAIPSLAATSPTNNTAYTANSTTSQTPRYTADRHGTSEGNAVVYASPVSDRARPRDRIYRNGPSSTYTNNIVERNSHHRWYVNYGTSPTSSTVENTGSSGGPRRTRARSGSSSAGSGGSSSRSGSTSSAPRSPSSSSSRASSPGNTDRSRRKHQWTNNTVGSNNRPLAICVRNLPQRSSDSSLKDGLFHEYKKHGKVSCVKVVGVNQDRYAVVCFKKPSDVEKALEVSQDKLFFGCKISVGPYQGQDVEDNESRPYETDLDEFHPKATRTLFIGNLEKDVTPALLREKFKHFGKILEIDIKKQGGGAGYAFCQYANISSVVDAIRSMDGEHVGGNRVKLGFGKSMATTCVWIDGVTEQSEKQVFAHCERIGHVTQVTMNKVSGNALVVFEQVPSAQQAVKELRGLNIRSRKLQVDFASRECQDAFYEQLEKQNAASTPIETRIGERFTDIRTFDSTTNSRYDGGSRTRVLPYSRSSRNSRFLSQNSGEHFDSVSDFSDRRFRYDEFSGGSGSEAAYDGAVGGNGIPGGPALQSVVVVSGSPAPPPPPQANIRHLQKERVHLLEQLEECPSSGDELVCPKKRFKSERSSLGRRPSGDSSNRHHRETSPNGKRRRGSETSRHHWRSPSPLSRPGTPLHDERPDSPVPCEPRRPLPPRRTLPMCLPLPRFAAQVLGRVPPPSPPCAPTGPAPPASPTTLSLRVPSPASSGGSSPSPAEPSLDERIRSLDEKYEKWSGSRTTLSECADRSRFRHHLLDLSITDLQPSEVMRSVLAKPSVFDEDSKRLESICDKYEVPPRTLNAFPSPSGTRVSPSPLNSPQSAGRSPYAGSPSLNTLKSVVPPAQISTPTTPSSLASIKGLQYPFPSHPPNGPASEGSLLTPPLPPTTPSEVTSTDCKRTLSERLDINHMDSVNIPRMNNVSNCSDRVPVSINCNIDTLPHVISSPATQKHFPPRSTNLKFDFKINKSNELKSPNNKDSCLVNSYSEHESVIKTEDKTKLNNINSDNLDRRKSEHLDVQHIKTEVDKESFKSKLSSEKLFSDKKLTENKYLIDRQNSVNSDYNVRIDMKSKGSGVDKFESSERKQILKDDKEKFSLEKEPRKSIDFDKKRKEDQKEKDQHKDEHHETLVNDRLQPIVNDKDNVDKAFIDKEKLSKDHFEHERREKEKIDKERIDRERIEKERMEKERKERAEKERVEKDRLEKERKEKLEKEQEKERIEKEKADKERKERLSKENREKERRERSDREHHNKEKQDREKSVKVKSEKEKDVDHDHQEKVEKDKNERSHDSKHRREKEHKKRDEKELTENSENISAHIKEKRKEKDEHSNESGRHRHRDGHKKDSHSSDKKESSKSHENNKAKDNNNSSNSRKISRDETPREISRKDSSDSTTSRNSYDSSKSKEIDLFEPKEEKQHTGKSKHSHETHKSKHHEKETNNHRNNFKDDSDKSHTNLDTPSREKKYLSDEKQRHYSLDSHNEHKSHEQKRKERLNSSCSLPGTLGSKRRISSQENSDVPTQEFAKKPKLSSENKKISERRDSKDLGKHGDKNKHSKSKNMLLDKIDEKIKEEVKSIKEEDDKIKSKKEDYSIRMSSEKEMKESIKDNDFKMDDKDIHRNHKMNEKIRSKKSPKESETEIKVEISISDNEKESDSLHKAFFTRLELRSNIEDEKQKALKKEMKEKKRLQQLQQIQQLQMQQNAMQHQQEKKVKSEERKKDNIKDKRLSNERKSREEPCININKPENIRKKPRKITNSTDTSDSDEPKKHSIFDIVDDGPTYISMYDKVKARSCKNMQKQEEEKRQEKIKAKFSQLKQSRAKREEKKRSNSWDEDSDSDREHKKSTSKSLISSSEDELRRRHKENITTDSENDHEKFKYINKFEMDEESNDEARNKFISRKNSRSRIVSDTSEDEAVKRDLNKTSKIYSISFDSKKHFKSSKKDLNIKSEPLEYESGYKKSISLFSDNCIDDKKSIMDSSTLFHEAIKTESLLKQETKCLDVKPTVCDISSEGEGIVSDSLKSNTYSELRKKHKKKQKRQKSYPSEDEAKKDYHEKIQYINEVCNAKAKLNSEKRKHSNKKDKKRDKFKSDLSDMSSMKDEKLKPKKSKCDSRPDLFNNIKRGEKMQDIFGPFSDDSDEGNKDFSSISEATNCDQFFTSKSCISDSDSICNIDIKSSSETNKDRFKEDSKKRKEKRKERKSIMKEDENSLDVDAAGKAIEANLFADSISDIRRSIDKCDLTSTIESDVFHFTDGDESHESSLISVGRRDSIDQIPKRESKEKKKKKKRSKEERRKDHYHHHHHHHEKVERNIEIDLTQIDDNYKKEDLTTDSEVSCTPIVETVVKPPMPSPSLPRLIDDSPPPIISISSPKMSTSPILIQDSILSPPLPKSGNKLSEKRRLSDKFIPPFGSEIDETISENAVKSISSDFESTLLERKENIDNNINSALDCDSQKSEDKLDEKPRAVISQEETEDAVAALLGESFGGRSGGFSDCYSENTQSPSGQLPAPSPEVNDVILDEEAEEMRQAVQNLNASELEIKPDTPQSESNLQIDTDTDEETPTETPTKVQSNNNKGAVVSECLNTDPVSSVKNNPNIIKTSVQSPPSPKKSQDVQIVNTDESATANSKVVEPVHPPTVISKTWALNPKNIESQQPLLISTTPIQNRDDKSLHITTSILHLKPISQPLNVGGQVRPILTAPGKTYQVVNQITRPAGIFNTQPPTIKIPEQHVLYQRPSGIVISPRMASDIRLHSPKSHQLTENQQKMANMMLTAGPPALTSPSNQPNLQKSPGQITVVRMQQPPLSPIQTSQLPINQQNRTMLSPNQPNALLIQNQNALNRIPITPVLAPISKTLQTGNVNIQQVKPPITPISVNPPKLVSSSDIRKNTMNPESVISTAKILLSSPAIMSQNPTILAQNRLIAAAAANTGIPTPNLLNANLLIKPVISEKPEVNIQINGPDHIKPLNQSAVQPSLPIIDSGNEIKHNIGENKPFSLPAQGIPHFITGVVQLEHRTDSNMSKTTTQNKQPVEPSKPVILTSYAPNVPIAHNIALPTAKESNLDGIPPLQQISTEPSKIQPEIKIDQDKIDPLDKVKCETDFEELLKQTASEIKIEKPPHLKLCPEITETKPTEIKTENKEPVTDSQEDNENIFSKLEAKENSDSKDDNDGWSAKEVNIDSVIKKVDALCASGETSLNTSPRKEEDQDDSDIKPLDKEDINITSAKPLQIVETFEDSVEEIKKSFSITKRGGRGRGRRPLDRMSERVQTRQGNKPPRGALNSGRRGSRGKAKFDKKPKTVVSNTTTLPGDVYDFHEDSGDESADLSQSKNEQRPRLILTIKSPITNTPASVPVTAPVVTPPQKEITTPPKIVNVVSTTITTTPTTNTATIAAPMKDEKGEDHLLPASNTRKSRRLLEKDVTRTTVDDIIDDVVKGSPVTRNVANLGKDSGPVRRSTRLENIVKPMTDKLTVAFDIRKFPKSIKKPKERGTSESEVEGSDEKITVKDPIETESENVVNKPVTEIPAPKPETVEPEVEPKIIPANPKKKMISEINAKLNISQPKPLVVTPIEVKVEERKVNETAELKSPVVESPNINPTPIVKPESDDTNKPIATTPAVPAVANLKPKEEPKVSTDNPEELMIDPVTGELVYMRRSADGNFVPVSSSVPVSSAAQVITSSPVVNVVTTSSSTAPAAAAAVVHVEPLPKKPVLEIHPPVVQPTIEVKQPAQINQEVATPAAIVTNIHKIAPPPSAVPTSVVQTISSAYDSKEIPVNVPVSLSAVPPQQPHVISSSHNVPVSLAHVNLGPNTSVVMSKSNIIGVRTMPPSNLTKTLTINQIPQVPAGTRLITSGPISPRLQQSLASKITPGQIKPINMQPQIAHPPQKQILMQVGQAGALGPGSLGPSLPRGAQGQHASPPLLKHVSSVGSQPVIAGANSSRVGLTAVPTISPQGHSMHPDIILSRSPPPAHQQTSPITPGEGVYPHFAHHHYQQYYRPYPDVRATPSPYVARSPLGAEGSEAPSPPLELRRPPCARVPHPAHSPSLSDRSTDSPQVAQMYIRPSSRSYPEGAAGDLSAAGNRYYESPAPPPAHAPRLQHHIPSHHRIIMDSPKLPSITQGPGLGIGVDGGSAGEERGPSRGSAPAQGGAGLGQTPPGPPHASHAPREADSLMMLLTRYPVMWQGLLALKNDAAAVQMHFVHGNPAVASHTLPSNRDGSTPPLRIAQRMRLEPVQLEGVARKMQMENEHCMLLALPCGRDHLDVLQQSTHLNSGFITYLQRKQAAGIVNIAPPGHHQALYTVHIFPSCDFANENLERIAPDLLHRVADIAHLLIVIATV